MEHQNRPSKSGKWWSIGINGTQFLEETNMMNKPILLYQSFLWSMCRLITSCASPWLLASQPSGDRVVWGQPSWKLLQQKSPSHRSPAEVTWSHLKSPSCFQCHKNMQQWPLRLRRCSLDQACTFALRVPGQLGAWCCLNIYKLRVSEWGFVYTVETLLTS